MTWRPLLALTAVLLAACGSAAPRPALGGPEHPPLIRADQPLGAGVPVPTPTPTPVVVAHAGIRIQVPELGIDLKVVEGSGLEPDYYVADHYPGMKWPGEGGRSFIYAHAQPGMFGALLGAGAVGQHVQVLEPNGSVLHYTIQRFTRNWPVTDVSIIQPADHEELILYTCTSWTYADPKVVAWAEPDAA